MNVLLFYLLSWVPDTIVIIVKYGSSKNVDSISLSGIFLHQCSLEVAPYSWEWQTETEGCVDAIEKEPGILQITESKSEVISPHHKNTVKIIRLLWQFEEDSTHMAQKQGLKLWLTYSWKQDTWEQCWWWGQHHVFCLWSRTILSVKKEHY